MAKITRVFASGSLGNLVFYEWKGKPVVRTRPARVRQSVGTINESSLFGKAKTISRILRQGLAPVLGNPRDRQVMYILDAAVRQWLKSRSLSHSAATTPLEYLDLRQSASFRAMFRKPIAVDWSQAGKLVVSIPPLKLPHDVPAPDATDAVCLALVLAGCSLKDFSAMPGSYTEIEVEYVPGNTPARELVFGLTPQPGSMFFLAAGLHFLAQDRQEERLGSGAWLPAAIIGSRYIEVNA